MTTSARSILPTDYHTIVSRVVDIDLFNRSSLRLETYFKGSSVMKRLRKAAIDSLYCAFTVRLGGHPKKKKKKHFV